MAVRGCHTAPAESPWDVHVSGGSEPERPCDPTQCSADKGVPMRLRPRSTTLLVGLGTAAALSLQVAPAAAHPGGGRHGGDPVHRPCTSADTVPVPGAERAETACLADITTAGLLTA